MFGKLLKRLFGTLRRQPTPLPDRVFEELLALDSDSRLSFIFKNPLLLSPRVWREFEQRRSEFKNSREMVEAQAACKAVFQTVTADPSLYPVGDGPIERLLNRVKIDEISLEGGEQLASQSDTALLLSPVYVRRISYWAQDLTLKGGWRQAVKLHKLTLAAVAIHERETDEESFEMRLHSTLAWIDIVTRATTDLPDGRLYRDALKRGQALKLEAEQRDDSRLRSEVLRRMGVLHLDPYVTGRTTHEYLKQIKRWQQRLADEFEDLVLLNEHDKLTMPEPTAAFNIAIDLLSEASKSQTGLERAKTLKPLAEALFWVSIAGGAFDKERFINTADEAIALFDPQRHQPQISALTGLRSFIDENSAASGSQVSPAVSNLTTQATEEFLDRILALPVAAIEQTEHDLVSLINLLTRAASQHQEDNPERALSIWEKAFQLSRNIESLEHMQSGVLNHGIELFRACYGRDGLTYGVTPDLGNAASALAECAAKEEWTEQEYFDAVVALAIFGASADQEEQSLQLLESLEGKRSSTGHARAYLTKYLRASLKIGAAVNAYRRQSFGEAGRLYLNAVPSLLDLGLYAHAMDIFARVGDVLEGLKPEDMIEIIGGLAVAALTAEEALGQPAVELTQKYCKQLVHTMQKHPTANATEMLFVSEIAKGLRFAATLCTSARFDWQSDSDGLGMLNRITSLRAGLPPAALGPATGLMESEILLSAYIDPSRREAGTNDLQILTNLMRAYDGHVMRQLLARGVPAIDVFQSPEDLQQQISERTVLLLYFAGYSRKDTTALWAFVVTRDSVNVIARELDEEQGKVLQIALGRARGITNFFGVNTLMSRFAIQENPPPGHPISSRGDEMLQELAEIYIGPSLKKLLKELRSRGKDHLCIGPQGPLHFFPFHLLELEEQPLAANWTITYLPNLRLLGQGVRDNKKQHSVELSAFGLDFVTPYDSAMPQIPEARQEAEDIASLYGLPAMVNAAATKETLMQALQESKRVHIATHGRHQADAPLFQCIYLADGSGYAPLYAYEFLNFDLRHVDLLTLSACETALGRFDSGDNLRGLPASFFLCGVSTIIGTLWEVETSAATAFFVSLYRELHKNSNKLDAFGEAQRQTRSSFPEYRDWGCFYMAGGIY